MMKSVFTFGILGLAGVLLAAFAHPGNNNGLLNTSQIGSAAFRDGAYLGTLAARRAEAPRIAFGRWAFASDRQLFTDGYAEAYERTLALMVQEKFNTQNTGAAYRDGLYQGQLDANEGRPEHVASGRWGQSQDRESFAVAYRHAYADTTAARVQKAKGTTQALLVR